MDSLYAFSLLSRGRSCVHEQSHCADQPSSTTFQKYLLRNFLVVFCKPGVLANLRGLLLCARAALTKTEDELAFSSEPVNIYSSRQAVKKLLLSCFGICFSCLAGKLPQSLPHWQLLFVQRCHVGVHKRQGCGSFPWIARSCFHFLF